MLQRKSKEHAPRVRAESITHALGNSNMVNEDVVRERMSTTSKTIWDSPQPEHETPMNEAAEYAEM